MTKQVKALSAAWMLLALAACSGEAELFTEAQATTLALVGDECPLSGDPAAGEVFVEHPAECGDAVCLGLGTAPATCSCRCSGEEGGSPLCECPAAYHCEDELIAELTAGSAYAGGYCVSD
jgi:hypothetical protein